MYYSISVMAKFKFFDVVMVFNEYELLKTRINVLSQYVGTFVIFDFGVGCENFASNNVIHIKAHKEFLSKDFDLVYETIKIIDPKNFYVEDILVFSKVHEIPDFKKLMLNLNLFNKRPFLLGQKKVFWGNDKISSKQNFSVFTFTYSHYLHNKNIQDDFSLLRNPVPVNHLTLDCGWQLHGFQEKNEYAKSLEFWYDLKFDNYKLNELHSAQLDLDGNLLIEEEQDLPQEFNEFVSHQNLREGKEFLITLDRTLFETSEGAALLIEKNTITTNLGVVHNFTLPTNNFYDTNSELDFSKNESLKVLKKLGCLGHDSILLQKEKTLEKVTLTYREFVDSIPSELF